MSFAVHRGVKTADYGYIGMLWLRRGVTRHNKVTEANMSESSTSAMILPMISSVQSSFACLSPTCWAPPPTPPTMSHPTDLPPITLILQEVQAITSSMRRNQRWASTSSSFSSSSAPTPPYLHAARGKQRERESLPGSSKRGRGSSEGLDEGDLMVGFIDLRRSLAGVKGSSRSPAAPLRCTRSPEFA